MSLPASRVVECYKVPRRPRRSRLLKAAAVVYLSPVLVELIDREATLALVLRTCIFLSAYRGSTLAVGGLAQPRPDRGA